MISYLGSIGALLVIFGIFGGVVVGNFAQPLVLGHLVLGLAALCASALYKAKDPLRSSKKNDTVRAVKYGGFTFASTVLVMGITIAVYWIAEKNNKRFDLTENSVFSLSTKSVEIVKKLDKPLTLVGIVGGKMDLVRDDQVRSLLNLYSYASSNVKISFLNPIAKQSLVEKYGLKPGNAVYVQYDNKGEARVDEPTEEAVTNAIVKLTHGEAKKVYFIEGHGEPGLKDAGPLGLNRFAQLLTDQHLDPTPLLLAEKGQVPTDAAAVVLVSPKKSLLPAEIDALSKYQESNGRLLLLTDPRTTTDVASLASKVGITVNQDVIVDQVQRLFAGPELGVQPIARTYGQHAITKDFTQSNVTIFTMAASVSAPKTPSKELSYIDIVSTGRSAWGETNLSGIFESAEPSVAKDSSDHVGPVAIGVAYEKKAEGNTDVTAASRVVVYGDSDFILNGNVDVYANRDLAINSVNWLAGEEGALSIGPKTMRASAAPISSQDYAMILTLSFIVPEIIVLAGILISTRRRVASIG